MSMSSTLLSEKDTNIAEPTLELIDLDDAAGHILKHTRKTSSAQDDETIKSVRKDCKEKFLTNLFFLINKLILDQQTFGSPKGLSDTDRAKDKINMGKIKNLRALPVQERREFSAMFAAMARGFENSPFATTIKWWTEFLTYFKAYKSWEDLEERIKRDGNNAGKSKAEINEIKSNLAQLLKDWSTHCSLAHYTCQDIYDFYHEYLNVAKFEAAIDKPDSALNFTIKNYLREVSAYKNALKKQVMSSMIARMAAAIDHGDLEYDDLLMDLIVNIKKTTGIDIKRKIKVPEPRKSMTPKLFLLFAQTIKEYCKANPMEADIIDRFANLKINVADYNIADDPIFSYCNYVTASTSTSTGLLKQIEKEKSLTSLVLNIGFDYDKASLLYKLNLIIISVNEQYKALLAQNKSSDVIARFVKKTNASYMRVIETLSKDISIKMSKDCMELCRIALTNNSLDADKLGTLIENIENARLFAVHYLKKPYYEPADMIMAVSRNILSWCADGNELTARHCQMIYQIIAANYRDIGAKQLQKLEKSIKQLIPLTKNAQEVDNNLLHHIIRIIEADIISVRGLEISLYRHETIAEEAWLPLPDVTEETPNELRRVYLLLTYIEKVMLLSENTSPRLAFANFDNNSAINTLDELKVMIEKLKLPKSSILVLQKKATELRHKLEEKTLDKLNKKFLIKNHILLEAENSNIETQNPEIDFNKLQNLVDKTTAFFKTADFRKAFQETTIAACSDHAANYCINLITDSDNQQINLDYLEKISATLGVNIIAELAKQSKQFWSTFETAMKEYNGVNTTYAKLLIRLFPDGKTEQHNDCVLNYAQKRLKNIQLNNEVTQDDYAFFAHFQNHPDIDKDFKSIAAKTSTLRQFNRALEDGNRWDEKTAKLIELFADINTISLYRKKRAVELFSLTSNSNDNDDDDNNEFFYLEKFKKTINHHHKIQGALFDAKSPVTSKTTFAHFIDKAIEKSACTVKLLDLVSFCGSKEQQQSLHIKAVKTNLQHASVDLTEWLNDKIEKADENQLTDFFGANNIVSVLNEATNVLTPLNELNKNIEKTSITPELMQQTENAVKTLLPLQTFYLQFSVFDELRSFFRSILDFLDKVKLYFSINQTLKNDRADSELATNNPELRQTISTFKKVNESANSISPQNIKTYLHMLEVDILSKILECTTNKHPIPDPDSLFTLTELLDHLSSAKIKELLLEAITPEINENPYWTTLVNSLDQANTLNFIEDIVTQQMEEKYKNARFDPDKPSTIEQDSAYRNESEGILKALENNDPLLTIDHDSTIPNPDFDYSKQTIINPDYNKDKPLSNANHPYLNSEFLFINFSDSFKKTLLFANRLCLVKTRVNALIKRGMCEEAKINEDIHNAESFAKTLGSKNVDEKQLLSLWAVCYHRLKSVLNKKSYLFPLANMFVSMLVAISNAILCRATSNKKILNEFFGKLAELPTLYMLINSRFREKNSSRRGGHVESIWHSLAPAELLQRPLMLTTDKACVLKMQQAIEQYVKTKLKDMKNFLDYYDSHKPELGTEFIIDTANLKKELNISKDSTATKISFALAMYHKITYFQEGKCDFNSVQTLFNNLLDNFNKKDIGGDLNTLLTEIKSAINTDTSLKMANVAISSKTNTPITNRRLN